MRRCITGWQETAEKNKKERLYREKERSVQLLFCWREKEVSRRIKKGETADTSSVKEQEVIQDDKFIYP